MLQRKYLTNGKNLYQSFIKLFGALANQRVLTPQSSLIILEVIEVSEANVRHDAHYRNITSGKIVLSY